MNNIYGNKPILPIGKPATSVRTSINRPNDAAESFESVLQHELLKQTEIKFSKHAMERLQMRNIKLSSEDIGKISSAVNKAAEKGVKETLIIMGNAAFIANVKSRTIITAAAGENLRENVFTNIDGAVII